MPVFGVFRLSVEQRDVFCRGENVAVHRSHGIGAGRVGAEVELGVQGVELEGVVMIRSGRRARTEVASRGWVTPLQLMRAVRQIRARGHALRQFFLTRRNVPDEPVSDIVYSLLRMRLGIVEKDRKALRGRGRIHPLDLRRSSRRRVRTREFKPAGPSHL